MGFFAQGGGDGGGLSSLLQNILGGNQQGGSMNPLIQNAMRQNNNGQNPILGGGLLPPQLQQLQQQFPTQLPPQVPPQFGMLAGGERPIMPQGFGNIAALIGQQQNNPQLSQPNPTNGFGDQTIQPFLGPPIRNQFSQGLNRMF